MFRGVWTTSVILLIASAGCSVLPVRSEKQDVADGQPLASLRQSLPKIQPVAFEDDSNEPLPPFGVPDQAEPVPIPTANEPETAPLTLADVEDIAVANNPTLSAAAARISAARGRQVQAGLYPNPVMGYHGTEIGNLGTDGQQGGFISQRFITGGKLKLDQAAAGKVIRESHFRFHAQERRVLTDVRIRFYEALAAQRRVELTRELAQLGDDLVVATEKLLEGRLKTENDLLQAQIRAEEAQILLDNARNEFEASWRRLVVVVGTPALEKAPLQGNLETDVASFTWENCHAMVLARNPEMQAARARAGRARILVKRARQEPVPNVDISISVRHITPTDSDVANVQVGIPVPIFDRNQGNIRAAKAEWVAACRELERIELDLQDRLAVAYRRYANARQQANRYSQKIIPKAERSLELVTDGYEEGQVDYLTLLTAQQTYVQVTLAYIDSLRELQAATAIMDGQLLSGSLNTSG